jgi:hypothetical protein
VCSLYSTDYKQCAGKAKRERGAKRNSIGPSCDGKKCYIYRVEKKKKNEEGWVRRRRNWHWKIGVGAEDEALNNTGDARRIRNLKRINKLIWNVVLVLPC